MTDLYWDPIAPELRDDPYPLWRRLRDEAPVYRNDRLGFYALSRFDDIELAHRDAETFSSSHGTTLETMAPDPYDTAMIIWLDAPKHTTLRKLVSRAFTVRRVTMLEERIHEICAQLLDPQVGSGGFDYVQDFAAILPPTVISILLGVPGSEREELRHIVDNVFHMEEGVGMNNETSLAALGELGQRLGAHFADRRTHPRDDVFTDLVNAEVADEVTGEPRRLTDEELASFAILLFSAGSETVARHLGWAASALDEYPDQRAELVRDPGLIPGAIEEILRYEPPSPVNARWTTRDVTLPGGTIPANSRVILITGSAGRDERRYADPDRLDVHRKLDLHMTFGYGVHFCLGAALARREARIGLAETLLRWPQWSVDRARTDMLYTSTVRGPLRLPIRV
ncbi:cytochrome P450 [Pseudofrankia inefficax]|uniref:Cytochrome P450 n=1 Tax=Pseudofrankia inefficax (strain DSM 45817 / CECT 9037 / DDB 130130 / EuI1c) TaxID=298654 RepID=E3JBZ1_PSEI1|nr:cytochrome P450 [Pseudofrankia inefficax]ADP82301.1 cytochrome P450 [Pseudofrankia inefficax]